MKKMKKRGKNFIRPEANLLFDILEKYLAIIENKKTDGATVREKNKVWDQISTEFNAISQYIPRTANQLKTFYENFKRRCRKDIVSPKQEFKLHDTTTRLTDEMEIRFLNMLKAYAEQNKNDGASTSYDQDDIIDYHVDSPITSIEEQDESEPSLPHQASTTGTPFFITEPLTQIEDSERSFIPQVPKEEPRPETVEPTRTSFFRNTEPQVRIPPLFDTTEHYTPSKDELCDDQNRPRQLAHNEERYTAIKTEIKQAVLKRKCEEITEAKELHLLRKRYMLNKIAIQENKILKQELELRKLNTSIINNKSNV